jgi:general secretion pathway protein A
MQPGAVARSGSLTYEPYYGLKEKPFSLSADPRFLYKSRTHTPVFEALRSAMRRREGIIVLTGEPGTGKTTLCRSVLDALDRKTFCTFVPDPFVSREDLLKMLLIDFGVMSVEDLKSGRLQSASRPELSYPLYDFLKSLVPLQAYAVLIIDEAQNLTPQLLEEIRILADLEGPQKLLQLVLVGQPELHDKLKDSALRQVDHRVSVRCSLVALDEQAVPEYLAHRLTVAGAGADRPQFVPDAMTLLFQSTKGNPRLLNLIADKCLHRAYVARTWVISADIVKAAIEELGYIRPAPPKAVVTNDIQAPGTPVSQTPPRLQPPVFVITAPPADASALADFCEEGPRPPTGESPIVPVPSAAPPVRRISRRLRRAAILAIVGVLLIMAGLAVNEWELRREELTHPLPIPPLPPPLKQHVRFGAAPVIPPASSFAYIAQ